jgi:hypothetical protein
MVTVMAVYVLVLAFCPRVKCRLHEMAADAEFRIILREIIEFEGNDTAAHHDDEHQNGNDDLAL